MQNVLSLIIFIILYQFCEIKISFDVLEFFITMRYLLYQKDLVLANSFMNYL